MQKRTAAKPKRMTIEDLAVITSRGFEGIEQKFGGLEKKVERIEKKVDDGFRHVNARLDTIRRDIADLDDLRERVQTLEIHTGLARNT